MQNGFCSKISISLLPNNCVEIMDDGRGIPLADEVQKSNEMMDRIFGNILWSKEKIEDFIGQNASKYATSIFAEDINS